MMTAKEKYEVCNTVLRILDGTVKEGEFKQFESLLAQSEEVRYLYIVLLETYAHLQKPGNSFKLNVGAEDMSDGFNSELWHLLSQEEMQSPSVCIRSPKPAPEKTHYDDGRIMNAGRRYNRGSLVSIIVSVAAILFLVVFIHFAPVRDTSYGQIVDHRQAVLKEMKSGVYKGKTLRNESLILESGVLEILMDSGSTIVLESPAELRLEDDNQVFLVHGKLAAKVPSSAIGFTVRTPSASVVDYGTEFGVLVDQYANTEAHVLQGEVELRLGSDIRVFDKSLRLSTNQAGRASGQTLVSIPPATHRFTYAVPSLFEYYAKSLQPMLYFQVKDAAADSFRDSVQSSEMTVQISDSVGVSSGPDAGGSPMGRALHFSGDGRGVWVKNMQDVRQHPEGAYTICFWIRFDRIAEQIVYANYVAGHTADSHYYRIVSMNEKGELEHSAFREGRGKWRTVTSPMPLKPDTWYFVVISNAFRTTKTMYLNGKRVADDSFIQPIPLELYQAMELGGKRDRFAGFEGSLGDILLFNRLLSEKEIRGLYESAVNSR